MRSSDVGLIPGDRRRTPGLRHAEVALLADVSVDYYERLEQNRKANPSEAVLADLARAAAAALICRPRRGPGSRCAWYGRSYRRRRHWLSCRPRPRVDA
ncbi:helix-turn-helix domain-containing protein [Streptomyces brasiliscabiei]|uniref:helix-turn-helix domain-containing protein n=1 Tax=Streptomyces brasiliscabiei TaxID=2736302 RepID=UPI001C0F65C4|nr:helix-turn-helix domain-containing protein [Streptomyces brasiliscabiei]